MTCLALTQNSGLYEKAAKILKEKFCCNQPITIDFSHPKPAFGGAYCGVYDFSISHSGAFAAIAVSDRKTGCDIELLKGKNRASVIRRFTAAERAEICDEYSFILNWTAKEAFIKMNAYAISTHLFRLEFRGGRIYLDGAEQDCKITHIPIQGGVVCVCGDDRICIYDI